MKPDTRRKLISAIALGAIVGTGAGAGLLTLGPAPAVDRVAASERPGAATTTVVPTTEGSPPPGSVDDSIPDTDTPIAPTDPGGVGSQLETGGSAGSIGFDSTVVGGRRTGASTPAPIGGQGSAHGTGGTSPAPSPGGNAPSNPSPAPGNGQTDPPPPGPPSAPQAASVRLGFDAAGTTIRRGTPLVAVVSWQPSVTGSVTSYQVSCRKAGATSGGSTITVGSDVGAVAVPNLPTGVAHSCSVVASGPGGSSPVSGASGTVTPIPAPPTVSIGNCQIGSPQGIIGERYLVQGLPATPTMAGASTATYRMRSSINQRESELRRMGASQTDWASLDEMGGAYAGRSGSSVTVWVEWSVSSGGATLVMQGPESSARCA